MEIYAGFLEHVDHHAGFVVDAIEELGVADNTLIYYMIGDNGAYAEGQLNGTFNELLTFNGMASLETPAFMRSKFADFGGPEAYNHYAVGWAHAMDTPINGRSRSPRTGEAPQRVGSALAAGHHR